MKEKQKKDKEERMNQYISEEVMGIFTEMFSSRFKFKTMFNKLHKQLIDKGIFPDYLAYIVSYIHSREIKQKL